MPNSHASRRANTDSRCSGTPPRGPPCFWSRAHNDAARADPTKAAHPRSRRKLRRGASSRALQAWRGDLHVPRLALGESSRSLNEVNRRIRPVGLSSTESTHRPTKEGCPRLEAPPASCFRATELSAPEGGVPGERHSAALPLLHSSTRERRESGPAACE